MVRAGSRTGDRPPTCQLCTLACSPPGGWWGGVGGSLRQSHVDRQSEAREDWLWSVTGERRGEV